MSERFSERDSVGQEGAEPLRERRELVRFVIDGIAITVCVLVSLPLLLFGGFGVLVGVVYLGNLPYTALAVVAVGAVVLIAAGVGRTAPRALWVLGVAAGVIELAAVWKLENWDLEGTYDAMVETAWGETVLVVAGLAGLSGLAFGLGTTITARTWPGRAGGLLMALWAGFWLTGSAF